MPLRSSALLQFLVVRSNVRLAIIIEGSNHSFVINGRSFLTTS